MSQPPDPVSVPATWEAPPPDAVERVVPYMPLVLPAVGAIMIFLLAFIAVYMA